MKLKIILFYLLFSSLFAFVYAQEKPYYILSQFIHDETNTLNPAEIESLKNRLNTYADSTGTQIVVLMIPTTGDLAIEDYSINVAQNNKIGGKGIDNGILLLIAKEDRKVRIEVGYGLEGVIPDILAKRIISDKITPPFKNGDFYGGIFDGVEALISLSDGEEFPLNEREKIISFADGFIVLVLFFPVFIFVGSMVTAKYGNKKGLLIVAILFFIVCFAITLSFVASMLFSLVLSLISMHRKGGGSGGGTRYGRSSSFGGFSSGGGFTSGGGFSGGGGSFGGGGASGGW